MKPFECPYCGRVYEDEARCGADDCPETMYPVADWQYEVANGDTRLGYDAWVKAKTDAES